MSISKRRAEHKGREGILLYEKDTFPLPTMESYWGLLYKEHLLSIGFNEESKQFELGIESIPWLIRDIEPVLDTLWVDGRIRGKNILHPALPREIKEEKLNLCLVWNDQEMLNMRAVCLPPFLYTMRKPPEDLDHIYPHEVSEVKDSTGAKEEYRYHFYHPFYRYPDGGDGPQPLYRVIGGPGYLSLRRASYQEWGSYIAQRYWLN